MCCEYIKTQVLYMDNQRDLRGAVDTLLHVFQQGYEPFVLTAIKSANGHQWLEVLRNTPDLRVSAQHVQVRLDATALVRVMLHHWEDTFSRILTSTERNMLYEVRHIRNKWAHQSPLLIDDVDRLADNVVRLLRAINAANAEQATQLRESLRDKRYRRLTFFQNLWVIIPVSILVVSIGAGAIVWWQLRSAVVPDQPTIQTRTQQVDPVDASTAEDVAYPCKPGEIKANPRTMIYHMSDGAYYANTRNEDIVCFNSTNDVENAGYRRSKR